MNQQIRFFTTISLLLLTEVALCALSVDFSQTYVKWGEPVVLKIKVTNPVDKTIQGGITISFSGNLIVTDHDSESKIYRKGSWIYYKSGNGRKCCVHNQKIVVENWYKRWHPHETKTMKLTFFALRTGILKTYIRATFIKQPSRVINIPETSSIQDQQHYPVIVKQIYVNQSDDFIHNFQLLIDTPEIGDSSEFMDNLQGLINNPKDSRALKYFGIQNLKNSPDYLAQLQKPIKNPKIANSPQLMYYLKRLINNPLDEEALRFFQIKVVKPSQQSPAQKRLEQAKKETIDFINQQAGGTVLVQLIEAEGDITFVPSRYNRIALSRDGRTYRFNKNSANLVLDIARTIKNKIKPDSQYINQAEPFSGKSYTQLINTLSN